MTPTSAATPAPCSRPPRRSPPPNTGQPPSNCAERWSRPERWTSPGRRRRPADLTVPGPRGPRACGSVRSPPPTGQGSECPEVYDVTAFRCARRGSSAAEPVPLDYRGFSEVAVPEQGADAGPGGEPGAGSGARPVCSASETSSRAKLARCRSSPRWPRSTSARTCRDGWARTGGVPRADGEGLDPRLLAVLDRSQLLAAPSGTVRRR